MWFILVKGTLIDITIGVGSLTHALHLSLHKLALILAQIWPCHHTFSMELILNELTLVHFARICEVILALTMKLSLFKITIVSAAFKFKSSFAGFLSLIELALVLDGVVVPKFQAVTML